MTEPNPTSAPTTDAPKDGDGAAENASGQDSKPQQPAPITEGARAKQFREVFRTALRQSLKKCSYANFASCFPTPAKKNPELLKSIWEQMCTFWDTHAQKEFEKILVERNVVPNLNELDQLVAEARKRKAATPEGTEPIAPFTLSPKEIVAAHLTPIYAEAEPQLEAELQRITKENAELVGRMRSQREEIRELSALLERTLSDLEGTEKELRTTSEGLEVISRLL